MHLKRCNSLSKKLCACTPLAKPPRELDAFFAWLILESLELLLFKIQSQIEYFPNGHYKKWAELQVL